MLALLHIEAEGDHHYNAAKRFLQHPSIDVNIRNKYNHLSIHTACFKGIKSHFGLKLLLDDARFDVNAEGEHGVTPLMVAVVNVKSTTDEHAQCARTILAHPKVDVLKTRSTDGKSALLVACKEGEGPDVAARLLLSDERCDVNQTDDDDSTPLMDAIWRIESQNDKHYTTAKLLLGHKNIDINMGPESALHKACYRDIKSTQGAQLLLKDRRCDINLQNDDGTIRSS